MTEQEQRCVYLVIEYPDRRKPCGGYQSNPIHDKAKYPVAGHPFTPPAAEKPAAGQRGEERAVIEAAKALLDRLDLTERMESFVHVSIHRPEREALRAALEAAEAERNP